MVAVRAESGAGHPLANAVAGKTQAPQGTDEMIAAAGDGMTECARSHGRYEKSAPSHQPGDGVAANPSVIVTERRA